MEPQIKDDLSNLNVPQVLCEIWRKGSSGFLRVRGAGEEKVFAAERGSLAVPVSLFPEKLFLSHLITSGLIDLVTADFIENEASQRSVSAVRIFIEKGIFTSERIWKSIERFTKEELFVLFDWQEGEIEFSGGEPEKPYFIRSIDIPETVLEGVRRMKNAGAIDRLLAPADEEIGPLSSLNTYKLPLSPCEKYLLGLLDGRPTVGELLASSQLGEDLTRRILGGFVCLGLAGKPAAREKTTRLLAASPADLEKAFGMFNDRCAYVFKYLARETGPVALSIIEKALDEIREDLDQALSGLRLLADGRLEIKSSLRLNVSMMSEAGRLNFLRSLDEIIMAEVLAVKKTLGREHEQNLVRGLEKVGEPR